MPIGVEREVLPKGTVLEVEATDAEVTEVKATEVKATDAKGVQNCVS